jgi:hypothetical protein
MPEVVGQYSILLRTVSEACQILPCSQLIQAAVETYEQALAWIGADASQADDTIVALYGVKVSQNPVIHIVLCLRIQALVTGNLQNEFELQLPRPYKPLRPCFPLTVCTYKQLPATKPSPSTKSL